MKKLLVIYWLMFIGSFAQAETIFCSGNTCRIGDKVVLLKIDSPMQKFARDSMHFVSKEGVSVDLKALTSSGGTYGLIVKANLRNIPEDMTKLIFTEQPSRD